MADIKIVGYKKMFGLILPDWISEKMMKAFVIGVLTVAIELLVFLLVIKPKLEDIKVLKKKLSDSEKSLVSLKQSRDGINKQKEVLGEQEQIKVLSAIPLSYSPERAIFVMRELASQTGVSIVSYSLPSGVLFDSSAAESLGNKGEMVSFFSSPVKISIAAPVDVLLKFISKLETSLPYGVVSDLNLQEITKIAKSGENKNVQIALEIKYFQAKLNKINISNISDFTEANMELADKIDGFSLLQFENSKNVPSETQIATVSGDMFGF